MKRLMLCVIALALMSTRALAQGGTIGGGGGGGNAVVTDSLKRLANGTAAAPSLAFLNSSGTGLYRFGADTLGFAAAGRVAFVARDSQFLAVAGRVAKPSIAFMDDATSGLYYGGSLGDWRFSSAGVEAMRISGAQFMGANGTAALPLYTFRNSSTTGLYRFGADTLGFAAGGVRGMLFSTTGSPTLIGGATAASQEFVIKAGLGQSQGLRFRVTDGSSVQQNALQLAGVTGDATFFGVVQPSADNAQDIGVSSNRWRRVYTDSIRGVGATSINGGAGNMTILAGTGASRTLTLQSTNASSTAVTVAVVSQTSGIGQFQLNPTGGASQPALTWVNDPNTGFYNISNADTIGVTTGGTNRLKFHAGGLSAATLTAASGTPNSVCIDATTKAFLENAATSCVVSSRRFKENIAPLTYESALGIVSRLGPSTFTYREGKRRALGLIAEDVVRVDPRLVTYDGKGQINSVNYEQVTIALLAVVQQQQQDIDQLHTVLLGLLGAGGAAGAGLAGWRKRKVT